MQPLHIRLDSVYVTIYTTTVPMHLYLTMTAIMKDKESVTELATSNNTKTKLRNYLNDMLIHANLGILNTHVFDRPPLLSCKKQL